MIAVVDDVRKQEIEEELSKLEWKKELSGWKEVGFINSPGTQSMVLWLS